MIYAPEWTFSIGPQYTYPIKDYGFLTFRADIYWSDMVYWYPHNFIELSEPDYWKVNSSLWFETSDGKWRFEGYVKNLFEKELTNAGFSMFTYNDIGVDPKDPRVLGLQVVYKF